MQKIVKFSGAIATGALVFSMIAPAAFAADVTISSNGAQSNNGVSITDTSSTTIGQSNSTSVVTNINSVANSGGNSASKNTGGDNSIMTGAASSTVAVSVSGSSNSASVAPCGCVQDPLSVMIDGNGWKSTNGVVLAKGKVLTVGQTNMTSVGTGVNSKAKTGKNKANSNTEGTNTIGTGPAGSIVGVTVTAPSNTVTP